MLACPADQISVADVVRVLEGPFVTVHGVDPTELRYPESAESLAALWAAVHMNIRAVLEHVSLHDLAKGRLPTPVSHLAGKAGHDQGKALTG